MKNPFAGLFGKDSEKAPPEEPMVIVPIPPLVVLLTRLEQDKGTALTQAEVLAARDGAVCMTMPKSAAAALEQARGYADLDPETVWRDWLAFKNRSET